MAHPTLRPDPAAGGPVIEDKLYTTCEVAELLRLSNGTLRLALVTLGLERHDLGLFRVLTAAMVRQVEDYLNRVDPHGLCRLKKRRAVRRPRQSHDMPAA
jgi:hypothetical protein